MLPHSQSEPVDTVIYTVFASDPDQGSGGNFHFVLTDPVNKISLSILELAYSLSPLLFLQGWPILDWIFDWQHRASPILGPREQYTTPSNSLHCGRCNAIIFSNHYAITSSITVTIILYLNCPQDEGSPPLTTTVYISVTVNNTVDAAPVFSNKLYFATIPEGVYSELVIWSSIYHSALTSSSTSHHGSSTTGGQSILLGYNSP